MSLHLKECSSVGQPYFKGDKKGAIEAPFFAIREFKQLLSWRPLQGHFTYCLLIFLSKKDYSTAAPENSDGSYQVCHFDTSGSFQTVRNLPKKNTIRP